MRVLCALLFVTVDAFTGNTAGISNRADVVRAAEILLGRENIKYSSALQLSTPSLGGIAGDWNFESPEASVNEVVKVAVDDVVVHQEQQEEEEEVVRTVAEGKKGMVKPSSSAFTDEDMARLKAYLMSITPRVVGSQKKKASTAVPPVVSDVPTPQEKSFRTAVDELSTTVTDTYMAMTGGSFVSLKASQTFKTKSVTTTASHDGESYAPWGDWKPLSPFAPSTAAPEASARAVDSEYLDDAATPNERQNIIKKGPVVTPRGLRKRALISAALGAATGAASMAVAKRAAVAAVAVQPAASTTAAAGWWSAAAFFLAWCTKVVRM